MEARARAAVAKLQELTQSGAPRQGGLGHAGRGQRRTGSPWPRPPRPSRPSWPATTPRRSAAPCCSPSAPPTPPSPRPTREAEGIVAAARAEATKIVDDAKVEGRKANEDERIKAEGEVQALARPPRLPASATSTTSSSTSSPSASGCATRPSALQDMVDRVPGRSRRRPPAAAVGQRHAVGQHGRARRDAERAAGLRAPGARRRPGQLNRRAPAGEAPGTLAAPPARSQR